MIPRENHINRPFSLNCCCCCISYPQSPELGAGSSAHSRCQTIQRGCFAFLSVARDLADFNHSPRPCTYGCAAIHLCIHSLSIHWRYNCQRPWEQVFKIIKYKGRGKDSKLSATYLPILNQMLLKRTVLAYEAVTEMGNPR